MEMVLPTFLLMTVCIVNMPLACFFLQNMCKKYLNEFFLAAMYEAGNFYRSLLNAFHN